MTRAARAAALAWMASMAAAAAPAVPVSGPAPDSYTAATTYAKLAPSYPFIRIAGSDVPPTVRALKDIVYVERGGLALRLDLYLPAAAPAQGGYPAIVFVHGGGWRTGVRDNFAPMAIRMAERGYAAATVSYRLSPQARYPAAIHDVKAAVRWVRAHAGAHAIDPGRIAVAGGSAGGQIASLVGVTNGDAHFDPDAGSDAGADSAADAVSSAVQAIVNIDGLSDFTSEAARRYEDDPAKQPSAAGAWFGGRYAEQPALWREASPLFHAGPATPPMLFIGSGQPRFSVGRDAMVARLRAARVPAEVVVLPDTPHSFWLFDPWLGPTVDATAAFLERHLRPR